MNKCEPSAIGFSVRQPRWLTDFRLAASFRWQDRSPREVFSVIIQADMAVHRFDRTDGQWQLQGRHHRPSVFNLQKQRFDRGLAGLHQDYALIDFSNPLDKAAGYLNAPEFIRLADDSVG